MLAVNVTNVTAITLAVTNVTAKVISKYGKIDSCRKNKLFLSSYLNKK